MRSLKILDFCRSRPMSPLNLYSIPSVLSSLQNVTLLHKENKAKFYTYMRSRCNCQCNTEQTLLIALSLNVTLAWVTHQKTTA